MKDFLRFLLEETRRPIHYAVAVGVGAILTVLSSFETSIWMAPFVVPFLVSSIGRATTRARFVEYDRLLQLPAMRESPAFVMHSDGTIEASMGRTAELFDRLGVRHISDFLSPEAEDSGESLMSAVCTSRSRDYDPVFYSPAVGCYYRVSSHRGEKGDIVLVWLTDVSAEREAERFRAAVRTFQIEVVEDLRRARPSLSGEQRLARLIIDAGFEAILFAHEQTDGSLSGHAIRRGSDGELQYSEDLCIPPDSEAPIRRSRQEGRAVAAHRAAFESDAAFERMYPVAPQMRQFLDGRVENLANYHAGATSIVAFNRSPKLTRSDLRFLESAVDAANSLFSAVHVASDRDLRFIQAIHGLCASAEFSDEITGKHIWRVNAYSQVLAETLKPDEQLSTDLGQVAAAHDIGKVAIPNLVRAPRRLTDSEFAQMQLHTVYGAQIIDRMIALSTEVDDRLLLAREVALNHHQRWDGKGYPGLATPDGKLVRLESRDSAYYRALRPLAAGEIPLSARIVSICDTYDALRSPRPYKPALTHEQAVSMIECDESQGVHGSDRYGPDVFEAWNENREEFREIYNEMSGSQ